MAYPQALDKSWQYLIELTREVQVVKFLSEDYEVDCKAKSIVRIPDRQSAKEVVAILILHYLIQELKGIGSVSGEWIPFRQLDGGEGYYPTFRKRVIERIIKKYEQNSKGMFEAVDRLGAEKAEFGDVGLVIEVFPKIKFLVTLWKGSEEFGTDANILFDKNVIKVFPTEDIIVLSEVLVSAL